MTLLPSSTAHCDIWMTSSSVGEKLRQLLALNSILLLTFICHMLWLAYCVAGACGFGVTIVAIIDLCCGGWRIWPMCLCNAM